MTDTGSAWRAAGERFAALGASLKAHYDQQHAEVPGGGESDLGEAARRFAGAIEDAVDAVGAAARNPEVTQEARETGAAVAEALGATFAEVADQLNRLAEGARASSPPPAGDGAGARPEEQDPDGEAPPVIEPWGTP